MWGSLLIIDRLISPVTAADLRAKEDDKLVLTWEQRRWVRGRFTTDKGRKIGLALPTGTTLAPDAVKIAFEVGSRHFPLALRGNKLLVPDDKAMIRLMDRIGVPWERRQAAF